MGPLLTLFPNPLLTPLLTRPLKNYFYRHFGVSELPAIFFLEMSRGTPPPPQKKTLSHLSCHPLSLCRGESSLQKRIALHGGVAAALTPIALHCATKYSIQKRPKLVQILGCTQTHPLQSQSKFSSCYIHSIEYAEHADQSRACCKHRNNSGNTAEKWKVQNMRTISAKKSQEPLDAPFLNELFLSGFSRCKTAPY